VPAQVAGHDLVTFQADPDDTYLGAPVAFDGDQMSKVATLEHLAN
jgi:hypothetical protein